MATTENICDKCGKHSNIRVRCEKCDAAICRFDGCATVIETKKGPVSEFTYRCEGCK